MGYTIKQLHASILFLVLFFGTHLSAGIVGTTKGEFAVNQGTASYDLKIDVPPGVAGMEPKLSLNFSSAGGNGFMGLGWNIGGVSAITRCPQTKAVDGTNHKFGVKYNANDRFCLDGQRLINVSGAYGAADTEYRTEIDTYSKIVSKGNYGGGPRYFEVKTKSGLKYIYGANTTTFQVGNGVMKFWKVDRIIDTYGNTIHFSYLSDAARGLHHLETVTYADNSIHYHYELRADVMNGHHAGTPFLVNKRLKTVVVKTGGAEVRRYKMTYINEPSGSKRSKLTSITEKVPEGDLRRLNFQWNADNTLTFQQNGRGIQDVYFSRIYKDSDDKFKSKSMGTQMADINGDGFVDLIQLYLPSALYGGTPQHRVLLGNGTHFVKNDTYSNSLPNAYLSDTRGYNLGTQLADINGDGLVDIIQAYRSAGNSHYGGVNQHRIFLNNGTRFVPNPVYSSSLAATNTYFNTTEGRSMGTELADINGDGLLDIIQSLYILADNIYGGKGTSKKRIYLNTGTGFSYDATYSNSLGGTYFQYITNTSSKSFGTQLADINGDGLVDIIQAYNAKGSASYGGNNQHKVFINNGRFFVPDSTYATTLGHGDVFFNATEGRSLGTQLSDVNGDGLIDIVQLLNPTTAFYDGVPQRKVILNTGKAFVSNPTYSNSLPDAYFTYVNSDKSEGMGTRLADINGDGLVDIIQAFYGAGDLYYGGKNQHRVYLNSGKNFVHNASYSNHLAATNMFFHGTHDRDFGTRLSDLNGDGSADLIQLLLPGEGSYGNNAQRRVFLNQKKRPLVTKITNNTDQDIRIDYKKMTDSTVYFNYSTHGQRNRHAWNNIGNDNIEITTSQSLVSAVRSANGSGGYNQIRYKYTGYVVNKLRGPQGFRDIDIFDDTTRMSSRTTYKQIVHPNGNGFQYTGLPYFSYSGREYDAPSGEWLSKTNIAYNDASTHTGARTKIYEPFTVSNVQTIYDPNTKTPIKSVYHYNYLNTDGLGNISKTIDRTLDMVNSKNFYKTTHNQYAVEDRTKWHIGRLTSAQVVHTQTDGSKVTRASSFKYNANGVLSEEVANIGSGLALTKKYTYDAKGNKTQETISGSGVTTASTTFGYSNDGKFQTSVTNAAGLTEHRTYTPKFGTLSSLRGPNGLTTSWKYDGLGRKIEEIRADGSWTRWNHIWSGEGTINTRYVYGVVQTQAGVGGNVATYYDSLGRETGTRHSSLNGQRILQNKNYNAKGELYAETLPFINGASPQYIRTSYDKYGRAVSVSKPGPGGQAQVYTTNHTNFTQTITNPKGQQKRTIQNAIGQTILTTDAFTSGLGATMTYAYDAAGNLIRTTDSAGNKIIMSYDAAGNKTYMKDPDLGVWSYTYNALGKVKQQWSGTAGVDGSKHYTQNTYDVLGRLVNKNVYDRKAYMANTGVTKNHTVMTYAGVGAAVGSRGKLIKTASSSLLEGGDWKREIKTISYDAKGRPVSTNTNISGRGDYLTQVSYDGVSRPLTITYPNGYKVTNHYSYGMVDRVTGSDGKIHYKIDSLNAFGDIANASFANGVKTKYLHDGAGYTGTIVSGGGSAVLGDVQRLDYTYDTLGNVVEREDNSIEGKYIRDTFTYDALNRLYSQSTTSDVVGGYIKLRHFRYDSIGNIISQSGGMGNYTYGSNRPHAVTQIVNAAGVTRNYAYDKVGNMIRRNGDRIIYNPLNKPAVMTNGKNGKEVRFYYGAGGARYMKTTAETETYYLGKSYEEQVKGSEETQIVYISIGGKTIGTHTQVINTDYVPTNANYAETPFNRYFHTDALGSITAITDDAGTVVERRSYEPFGKIRAMDYGLQSGAIIPQNTVAETTRAFTGHEQIAELSGLIHMNARVYDSEIGRFLSADTIIQDPHDSQSYNRYSYVRNNPLVFTDPSGHSWFSKLWSKVKPYVIGVVVAVLAVATSGALLLAMTGASSLLGATGAFALATFEMAVVAGAVSGFVAGVAGGLLNGASVGASLKMGMQGALWGAVGAGVASGIGTLGETMAASWGSATAAKAGKAILHGISRAAISKAQGGRWSGGFWSGFAASALAPLSGYADSFGGKMAISAIVGGTASELGGGKFANGAVSAAFVMLYNDLSHEELEKMRKERSALATAYEKSFGNNASEMMNGDTSVFDSLVKGADYFLKLLKYTLGGGTVVSTLVTNVTQDNSLATSAFIKGAVTGTGVGVILIETDNDIIGDIGIGGKR